MTEQAYYYFSSSNDPFDNIALEYYLYSNLKSLDTIYFFWVNSPSVFMGRYQYAQAECNLDFLKQNDIPVLRRKSGGGTVYHDLGNLNFTCIKNELRAGEGFDIKAFPQPIISALAKKEVELSLSPRGDLRYQGLKVGGSAETIRKGRMLYHISLLFDANLEHLEEALRVEKEKNTFVSRVASVRSKVANLRDVINDPQVATIDDFRKLIVEEIKEIAELEEITLAQEAEDIIKGYRQEIFENKDWIYSEIGKKKR